MPLKKKIKVIDLFCGIGGLTHGLIKEWLDVVAGKDILDVSTKDVNELFGSRKETIRVLAGCAPCQPFSKLNQKKR